jgi:16S rRNA (cytosine1402-N4)-methyltransferase
MKHIPVLLDESVTGLSIQAGDVILDGTLGGGGHTAEIIRRYGSSVKMICLDFDHDAIDRAKTSLEGLVYDATFRTIGFQDIDKVLNELNIEHVDRILLDLGLSSFQLDVSERGFSFMRDEPLLMTMKKDPSSEDLTASDIVNTWSEETLADIIYGFGEEKFSRRIAKAIVESRKTKMIKTTFDLVAIIDQAVGKSYKGLRIHPSTRTFQALRIATNGELMNLEKAITDGFKRLKSGGRMAIISFHSLEDRIVKKMFVNLKNEGYAEIITKRPITPTVEEIKINSRSRSSKLRIIQKK